MKATISRAESFLTIMIKCSAEGADINAKINAPGSPPGWSGPLDPREFAQLCFRLNRISNGELEIDGAQDYLTEQESFQETVRRQADAINDLVKRAEVAESAAKESLEAIQNQREVIEDLRNKLAKTDDTQPINVQSEPAKENN